MYTCKVVCILHYDVEGITLNKKMEKKIKIFVMENEVFPINRKEKEVVN